MAPEVTCDLKRISSSLDIWLYSEVRAQPQLTLLGVASYALVNLLTYIVSVAGRENARHLVDTAFDSLDA